MLPYLARKRILEMSVTFLLTLPSESPAGLKLGISVHALLCTVLVVTQDKVKAP